MPENLSRVRRATSERTSAPTPGAAPVVALYDGGCPLCRREIAHYQRLDQPHGRIAWVDVYADPERARDFGVEPRAALQRMHVIERGEVRVGAAAFVALWRALPGYRVLGAVVARIPGFVRLADVAYRWFARRRWRSRCTSGTCPIPDAYRAPLEAEPDADARQAPAARER